MKSWVLQPVFEPGVIALIALVLLGTTIYVYWQVGERLPRRRRVALLLLRLVALVILIGILLQPSRREEQHRPQREKYLAVAIDTSASMQQPDVDNATRFEAAAAVLEDSGLLANPALRLYAFANGATPADPHRLDTLTPDRETTRMHRSLHDILSTHGVGGLRGIVLLTDGRDFSEETPAQTALMARPFHAPIFAIPFGGAGRVRDLGVRLVNYQAFMYRRQGFRLDCYVRATGCQYEDIAVQLWRNGELLETRHLNLGTHRELLVSFELTEEELGLYEYEVRVPALRQEVDTTNNRAITYMQVIEQELRVLLVEGQPNWDTTFLRRALFANQRVRLDAVVQYHADRARILSNYRDEDFTLPTTLDALATYDVIILGQHIDRLLSRDQIAQLYDYVNTHGGSLIFARANAWTGPPSPADALQPVVWDTDGYSDVTLAIGEDAVRLAAFALPGAESGDTPPPIPASHRAVERKALAVALAVARDADSGTENPGIVYRTHGRGSVLSIGVIGLWRWSFNANLSDDENRFRRFWEHLLLWLSVNSDFMPGHDITFKANTYNLQLGETIFLQYNLRHPEPHATAPQVTVTDEEGRTLRLPLEPRAEETPGRLRAAFLPPAVGKYQATVQSADGESRGLRFAVNYDNPEKKEVAADIDYLQSLCASTGGRLLTAEDLAGLWQELQAAEVLERPKIHLDPLWDRLWLAYGIVFLLALEWLLRRRWGLC